MTICNFGFGGEKLGQSSRAPPVSTPRTGISHAPGATTQKSHPTGSSMQICSVFQSFGGENHRGSFSMAPRSLPLPWACVAPTCGACHHTTCFRFSAGPAAQEPGTSTISPLSSPGPSPTVAWCRHQAQSQCQVLAQVPQAPYVWVFLSLA